MENFNQLLMEKISEKGINTFTFESILVLVNLLEEQNIIPEGEFIDRITRKLIGEEKLNQLEEELSGND